MSTHSHADMIDGAAPAVVTAERSLWRPLAARLAGAVVAASFPPLSWNFLPWFAFIPLLWSLSGATPKGAAARGYLVGLPFMGGVGLFTTSFGGGVLWLAVLPWALFTAVEALWFIPIGMVLSAVLRRAPWAALAGAPAVWAFGEWARGAGPYGFPFGGLASAATGSPIAQWASVGGCHLVSAIVALAGTSLYLLVRGDRLGRKAAIGGLAALLPIVGWGAFTRDIENLPTSDVQQRVVLLAQGETNPAWGSDAAEAAFATLRSDTLNARVKPDLVVWPESAIPATLLSSPSHLRRTTDVPAQLAAPLLTGAIGSAPSGAPTNTAVLFRPNRTVAGTYQKRQLVPFGEFVPLRRVLPFLDEFGVVERDEVPGARYNALAYGPFRLGVPICFESASPSAARAFVRQGANLLVIITNDAWFGRTGMADQHLAAARLRAIETRRWVVQCGHTGISAIISPTGEIQRTLPLGRSGVLSGAVALRTDVSPYMKLGDWFVLACLGAIILALWFPMGIHTTRP